MTDVSPPKGRYLVLGATGLLGSHTLNVLKNNSGVKVIAVYHKKRPFILSKNILYVKADLAKKKTCQRLMRGMDYVMMFAGKKVPISVKDSKRSFLMKKNSDILRGCLDAASRAGVKKFIWAASTTGYPQVQGKLKEDQMFHGRPPKVYLPVSRVTRRMERLCQSCAHKPGSAMSVIVLRVSMAYGEYDNFNLEGRGFLAALVQKVVERQRPLELWGDGRLGRDIVYASDVSRAALLALSTSEKYDAFNIASGKSYTIGDLLNRIVRADGYANARIVRVRSKQEAVPLRSYHTQKARAILGFEARMPLAEGLKRMVRWYRRNRRMIHGRA